MTERHDYATPAWQTAMRAILTQLIAETRTEFPEADFTMCEIITDIPPDSGTAVLGARITGEGVTFFDEEGPADVVIRGDYAAMLPAARLHHGRSTPEERAAQGAHSMEMAKAGRVSMRGDMRKAPKPLLKALSRMHDLVADITA